LSVKDVRELFRLIDWVMVLPRPLAIAFDEDIEKFQEEKGMPFVTSIERLGELRGLRKGIEAMLSVRFGDVGLKLMPEIREILDEEKLDAILKALVTASDPEEVRRLWSPPTP
jgi:hypothetical protein